MTRRHILTLVPALMLVPLLKSLESVAFSGFRRPDFVMVLAVCAGLSFDVWHGLPAGFAIGLIEDLMFFRMPGLRAVSLCVTAGTASLFARAVNADVIPFKIVLSATASVLGDLASFGILRAKGYPFSGSFFVKVILVNSALWSGGLAVPFHFALKRLARLGHRLFPARSPKGGMMQV